MNFEKLKETARKYEQKEEWRRAIEVYLQAIREFEAGHDPAPDLAIYNRVGDLYLKANEPGAAVQAYEKAADLYKDQGFYNNAIALCGKILRVNPGRIQTYLTLAHLHARKNVVIEAKKNLLEYLERMNALGQLDDAFKSVKDFADQFPGNKEIRLMLSELLRASSRFQEAREQLEKLASDLEARGDTVGARKTLMKLQAMDSEEPGATPKPPARPKPGELVFLDTGSDAGSAEPKRPAAAPGRRTPSRGNEPTTRVLERTPTLEIIDVPSAEDEVDIAAEAAHQRESLQIETSSLSDAPLDLESVQPISDEASMEMTHLEVAQTLGFEPTTADVSSESEVKPLDGLEIDEPLPDRVDLEATPDLGIERASDLSAEAEEIDRVAALNEAGATDETPDLSDELAVDLEDLPPGAIAEVATEEGLGLDLIDPDAPLTPVLTDDTPDAEVLYIEEEPEPEPEVEAAVPVEVYQPTVADLEDRVLEDPDSPEPHRALGEALLAEGEAMRGQEELELALSAYENREDWDHASSLVNELIRLDPNGVRYHQKRVELAFRGGDRARLLDAYVELGDALMRVGAADKALAVYRRVAEHDPSNARAQAALDSMTPVEDIEIPLASEPEPQDEPPAPTGKGERAAPRLSGPMFAPSGDFIDLGALVQDDDRPRDARMRVEDEEPTGDEQKDFDEMLSQFKRGIDENLDDEDFEAHYDLGVAFREMGLLDEAIAEFQKALRAPEGRLKTSEALGTSFYDKGQFAIAESILRRAVESLGAPDEQQIGLLYWLARSREAQGKIDAALPCYERVVAVDIGFQDAGDRMARLTAERP